MIYSILPSFKKDFDDSQYYSFVHCFKKNIDDSQHYSFLPSFFVLVHLEVTLCSSRDIEIQELYQTLLFGFYLLLVCFLLLF